MRRILIENARRKGREKYGGSHRRIEFDDVLMAASKEAKQVFAIDEAIDKLSQTRPEKAQLVKLRLFAGPIIDESAQALGISRATAKRMFKWATSEQHPPETAYRSLALVEGLRRD